MRQLRSVSCVTKKSYAVRMERGLLACQDPWFADLVRGRRTLIVTTRTVDGIYGAKLAAYLREHGLTAGVHVLNCSEATKTLQTAQRICEIAQAFGIDRRGVLVAFGGGVCSDLVTVAASWIRRGIGHVRIPTTLVGQIDAAIGIKGAVNFGAAKNYLGCYCAPEEVLVDPHLLATLAPRDLRCGLSEMVKMALIRDLELFSLLESFHERLLASRFQDPAEVADGAMTLAIVRMLDQLEPNIFENVTFRRLVDMGHTFSPLIESLSGFAIAHGEAVAIDLAVSSSIAMHLGLLDFSSYQRIVDLLRSIGLPVWSPVLTPELVEDALEHARHHRGGTANLVVPTGIGEATFLDALGEDVRELLHDAIRTLRGTGAAVFAVEGQTSCTASAERMVS